MNFFQKRFLLLFVLVCFPASGVFGLTLSQAILNRWDHTAALRAQENLSTVTTIEMWRKFWISQPQLLYLSSDTGTADSWGLSASYQLPFKTLLLMGVDLAKIHAESEALFALRHELALQTADLYLDCAVTHAQIQLQKRNLEDLETLYQSVKRRYETGTSTLPESIGLELQLKQYRSDLSLMESRFKSNFNRLKQYFPDLSATDTLEIEPQLDPGLLNKMGTETADSRRAKSAYQTATQIANSAWATAIPDVSFSALRNVYNYLPGSPSGANVTYTYSASLTLPIFWPFYEHIDSDHLYDKALLDAQQAFDQLNQAKADQEQAHYTWIEIQRRLKELSSHDIPLAQVLVESTFSAYRTGRLGFAELLFSRKTYSDLKMSDVQLKASLLSAQLKSLSTP